MYYQFQSMSHVYKLQYFQIEAPLLPGSDINKRTQNTFGKVKHTLEISSREMKARLMMY